MKGIKERHNYIDYIRVFSIIMVIMLHCICDYYNAVSNAGKGLWFVFGFLNEVLRTGVPLFFMISGFLLLNGGIKDIKTFYKRRLVKIGVPFLIYNLFYYLTNSNGPKSFGGFSGEFLNNGSAYHLWFIYSIMFIYLMMPFIKIITDKCSLKMLVLFLAIITFQTTLKPFFNTLFSGSLYVYLTEDGIVGYLGYVVLGYILGKYDFDKKQRYFIYGAGILFMILTPAASMLSVMKTGTYLFHGGYSLNHYAEAAAIFLFFKEMINKKSRIISVLSNASLGAYFIHVFIIEKLKAASFELPPSALFSLWIIVSVVLSFVWGISEKKLTGFIKSVFSKKKEKLTENSYTG